MIHVNRDDIPADMIDGAAVVENESSGDDGVTALPDDLAKTKAARAQSEHRRRVELKESFERLRMTLEVPQPRAGKRDLVEQAITQLEFYKRQHGELMQQLLYLRQQIGQKYRIPASGHRLTVDSI